VATPHAACARAPVTAAKADATAQAGPARWASAALDWLGEPTGGSGAGVIVAGADSEEAFKLGSVLPVGAVVRVVDVGSDVSGKDV
jgi:hypothetical protein